METDNIVAISLPFPGVSQWLRHGHDEGFWEFHPVRPDTEMRIPEASTYVMGAWHNAYRDQIVPFLADQQDRDVHVAWSSSPTEVEMAGKEVEHLHTMTQGPVSEHLESVGCLHEGMVPFFENGWHLPAPLSVPDNVPVEQDGEGVGLYHPPTLKKNLFSQVLAVKYLQDEPGEGPMLYTNIEQYQPYLDHVGVDYTMQPWLDDHQAHLERLSEVQVTLCASHAESWSYAGTDSLFAGTVPLISPTIPWGADEWRVKDPNDPLAVKKVLERILDQDQPETPPQSYARKLATVQNAKVHDALTEHLDGAPTEE